MTTQRSRLAHRLLCNLPLALAFALSLAAWLLGVPALLVVFVVLPVLIILSALAAGFLGAVIEVGEIVGYRETLRLLFSRSDRPDRAART